MSAKPAESVLLCEGYHDRAFLSAWLQRLGCTPCKGVGYEPHGAKPLSGAGQYAFRSPNGGWLRVVPTHPVTGDTAWRKSAEAVLAFRDTRALKRLVVVLDHDGAVGSPSARATSFNEWATRQGARACEEGSFERVLAGGVIETALGLIAWSAPDAAQDHLPAKQTVERLACAAFARAHRPKSEYVARWIAGRPSPPTSEKIHKTHAASHMAGWFSDRGYEGWFEAIWQDEATRPHLEALLDEIGAGPIVAALLGTP